MTDPRPMVRDLDIQPVVHQGRPSLVLRDPLRLSPGMVVIPRSLSPLLLLCDGSRDVDGIATDLSRMAGIDVPASTVAEVVESLDGAYLFDNDRMREAHRRAIDAWRARPQRPPSHAGAVYPADAVALRSALDDWMVAGSTMHGVGMPEPSSDRVADRSGAGAATATPHGVPGPALEASIMAGARRPSDARLSTADGSSGDPDTGPRDSAPEPSFPVGVLSPHIDYGRGGTTYGAIWSRAAAAARAADLAILIGTDHFGPGGSITLTHQSYATPFGPLPTDRSTVDALAGAIGAEHAFDGELRHRGEHSLELVAVWLHHVRGGEPIPTVPLLVGSFEGFREDPAQPEADPMLAAVLAVLRERMAERRVIVVASGDLAHVGPAFGGKPVVGDDRAALERADGHLLRAMAEGDARGFFEIIQGVDNGLNVCGVVPVWLTMQAVRASRARVLGYQQCPADDAGTSWVSIAGALFEGG